MVQVDKKSPGKRKAPIDWPKWIAAAGSVVGAIVNLVRLLIRG